jgi:hypothetical protein
MRVRGKLRQVRGDKQREQAETERAQESRKESEGGKVERMKEGGWRE